ncbi:MAG: hypothetical protein JRF65_02940 [Deltaproteobacteria bacterium]|nr:hypothetical protein [Deltaproteobacteria bacterium]
MKREYPPQPVVEVGWFVVETLDSLKVGGQLKEAGRKAVRMRDLKCRCKRHFSQ